jgi:signal transduction histidine kinase
VKYSRLSLLWKILLPTSMVLTLVFALAGWIVQSNVVRTTTDSVEHEARASFQAYKSLWQARADSLATVSRVLSTMSDVRRVFGTGDAATIRDTASEMWSKVSAEDAFFLVADPQGKLIASSLGSAGALSGAIPAFRPNEDFPEVQAARARFPDQASGFVQRGGQLFQVVITPVYVDAPGGAGLLNVFVTGYAVDASVATRLKEETGGSDFVFAAGGHVITSLPEGTASALLPHIMEWQTSANSQYLALATPLMDVRGAQIGQLYILRSFEQARSRIAMLRTEIVALWLTAMAAALIVMFFVAKRIMSPVADLDRAAAEIARQNYDYRVSVHSGDELGRLATTFNGMCESIQHARDDLTRQERIATIGRLSTSIVHDLRNPLAAIYAGSEMLVDGDLPQPQVRRLAVNIYRASRLIQEMLQQLLNASRGGSGAAEICAIREVVTAAWSSIEPAAEARQVEFINEVPEGIECPMERARMERVFSNLFENAVEMMPSGGTVRVQTMHSSLLQDSQVEIAVKDTGPGIGPEVRARLFQPFVTFGKRNGLGLGLALSRQTVLDHGGDMWVADSHAGAEFHIRLPKNGMREPDNAGETAQVPSPRVIR